MKTVIALYQSGNKGKTETLRFLAKKILKEFKYLILFSSGKSENIIPSKRDFRLVIQIVLKNRSIIVAIESQGDPKTNLKERLIYLEETYDCDLIFCTSRTRGGTVHAVDNLWRSKGYKTIWTSPYQVGDKENYSTVNELMARHLLEIAQSLELI